MSSIRDLKNETTLSSLAQQGGENSSALCWGVIIDISEPTKANNSSNFVTKLKIIDPSFHYKAVQPSNNRLKFHKFCTLIIYSETPGTAPKINCVGDIIRIRRFKFRITDEGELIGVMGKFSNWLIYEGEPNSKNNLAYCHKPFDKNINRELSASEKGRLLDLRKWIDNYFFSNSLQFITWWTNFRPAQPAEKVDLILLCQDLKPKTKTLYFVDDEGRKFELKLP
jgi:hypothetical protein